MAKVSNSIKFSTGGGSDITVVANYSALPDPTTVSGEFYWCSSSQGTSWLPGSLGGTYYNSGMYYSNGTTWEYINVPFQATQEEVNTGTNTDKFLTSKTFNDSTQLQSKADNSLFLIQQSDRTLTSNTSAQNIFDVGISGSGAITLLANSTYHFEMEMSMTGLSTTSGTISLSFDAGTANITLFKANVMASKATLNNNSTMQHTFMESTSVNPIVNASTVATAKVFVSGVLVCTTAGTFIPRVTMSQASASSVKAGTHLKMERLGSNTATHYPTS